MEIEGKVALVLGAAKGLGQGVALALAAAGARVIFTYYDWPVETAAMLEEVAGLKGEHLTVKVDLREPDQVDDLVARIEERYGCLDILVNNIERGGMPVVHGSYDQEVNRGQWDLEMATTLKAKHLVFAKALPLLKKAKEGAVINISSIAGMIGRSGPAAPLFSDGYSAANRAVSSFTETWARQAAPTVRVNEIMLGFFATRHGESTRGWELLDEKQQKALLDHTLVQRTGTLDDLIKTLFFLIRDAEFMTGAVLRLDGGYVLGGERVGPLPDGVV